MADKTRTENKAATSDAAPPAAPAETKLGGGTAESKLSAADKKRQTELAQSGYRLPSGFFEGAAERAAQEKAVAENQDPAKPAE